ncbi:MAG: winged helix-turn-helix domain-containing protein [Gammaproteobacteria bacterium]
MPVEPKALRLLELLLESGGALVDRDLLLDQLWGTVVVSPGSLTRLIAQLRRALDDDAASPRYIATVHTRGYRWLGGPLRSEPAAARVSHLPQRLIRLIGRDADLRGLERTLAGGVRLLTLIGPGGAGKTQLALELGRRQEQRNAASVLWVDLSTAIDAVSVSRLVAAAVGAHERADIALERGISLVIGERELLLILDNCERVAAAVAVLSRGLLSRGPKLVIVCTSQTTLDVVEESLCWVKPLGLPPPASHGSVPLDQLMASDAAQLFMERARAAVPDFTARDDNAQFIAEICRRLDGLPLAIELAAPWLATLTPQQLLAALDDRFVLLTRRAVVLDLRHQSLQAAVEWSFALLEPPERQLLELCGVFAGTWSIEAAAAVANIERPRMLNLLQGLVQRSLLAVERVGDASRYRLLDSVGAFACARLREGGREREVRVRHAQYFTALAASANQQLARSDQQLACLERLRNDWTNLIAAFEWASSEQEFCVLAAELVTGLRWEFCWISGRYLEADRWFSMALRWLEQLPGATRAPLLNGYCLVLFGMTDFARVGRLAAAAEAQAEQSGQRWEQAWALGLQAWAAAGEGRRADAEAFASRSVSMGAELGDPWLQAFAELGLAMSSIRGGDYADAIRRLTPHSQLPVGTLERGLRGMVSIQRALALFAADDPAESRRELAATVRLAAEMRNARMSTGCCELAAYLAASDADFELSAWLLGAAMTGREMTGAPLLPQWHASHDAVLALLKREYGEVASEAAKTRGQRTSLTVSFASVVRMHGAESVAPAFHLSESVPR